MLQRCSLGWMKKFVVVLFAITLCSCLYAQSLPATGTPRFNSFGGGPFDVVNLGNLNYHFTVPVFSRGGAGIPFYYNLTFDSTIWTPQADQNGVLHWTPAGGWGWQAQTDAATGYIVPPPTPVRVNCPPPLTGYHTTYVFPGFVDPLGTYHHVPFLTVYYDCEGNVFGSTKTADDGSGYTVTVEDQFTGYVRGREGKLYNVPIGNSGAATITDTNQNKITTTDGVNFYDTLSSSNGNKPVLAISTTSNTKKYTYTPPLGTNVAVTITYGTYNVHTTFNCTSNHVQEYPATQISLVKSITLADGVSTYSFEYETQGGYYTGRISKVTLPTGGTISYTYTGSNEGINCSDGSTIGLTRTLNPGGEWQYARSENGSTWTTTITSPPDPANTNSASDVTLINFAEDSATTQPSQNFYETQRNVYQGSATGTPLLSVVTCYNGNTTESTCPTASVQSPIKEVRSYTSLNGGSQSQVDNSYDQTYGMLTESDSYDFGASSPSRRAVISYATNIGNGIVDRPACVQITGGTKPSSCGAFPLSSDTVSLVEYNYFATTGNLKNSNVWNGSAWLTQSFTYFSNGTVQTATDVNNAQTTYTNGACNGAFPTSIAEPLSLARSMTWDCTGGVQTSVTDENQKVAHTNYTDASFWRPSSVSDFAGNSTAISYISPNELETTLTVVPAKSEIDQLTYSDGFGRVYLSQTNQNNNTGNYDTVQTNYDIFGRPYFVSLPCSASAGSTCGSIGKSTSYDALSRATSVSDSGGGSMSYAYNQNDVVQTLGPATSWTNGNDSDSEKVKSKQLEYDGLGRLTSVCEITGGTTAWPAVTCGQTATQTGYWTKYTYDALSHLTGVTQNAQGSTTQTRAYSYDLAGRLSSESNPESGATTYYWDAAPPICYNNQGWTTTGDLGAKRDANGAYSCYAYDALHRMTGFLHNPSGRCVGFVYDTATPPSGVTVQNTKGRLIEAYTNNDCQGKQNIVTDEWFGYSARGEATDMYASTPHSGGYYHLNQSYWPHGLVASTSLAGVPTIYNGASDGSGLDGEGRVAQVTASSGQSPVTCTPLPCVSYNPASQITQVNFGSGDFDTFSYDSNTGRITGFQSNVGTTGAATKGTLAWNANGTLQKFNFTDPFSSSPQIQNQTCTYVYDDLGRVGGTDSNGYSVFCGASFWAQTFSYDPFGNLSKSGSITWLPNYVSTTNQYSGVSYDADGNLRTDPSFTPSNTYNWDADGNLISANGNSVTYDAFNRMVELQHRVARWSSFTLGRAHRPTQR